MKNNAVKTLILATVLAIADLPAEENGPRNCSFDVRHLEYQGIGFNQGYTSFDLFLANHDADPLLYFLDARAHVFNDGKPAFNAGGGWRYPFGSRCQAIGFNAYYDYRKTKRFHYNQIGAGFEYLTPTWQLTANGYFPFGQKVSRHYDVDFAGFAGNNFFVSRKKEFALIGGDLEAGWHFMHGDTVDLFAGTGPYYFQGHLGKAAIGGKVRLEARITPYFRLEVGDSYDTVFKNRFHAEAAISIPFGPRSCPKEDRCCSYQDQMMFEQWLHEAPSRQEIVVVDNKKKTSLGLDPATGLPFFVIFVDNTSSSNGTYESPYASLATAEAASQSRDIIYVFPGNGTTTNMDMGITLKSSQRLLGSGLSHEFATTIGNVTIPAQSTVWPSIASPGSVVVLDINNEVSGFKILAGTAGVASGSWVSKTLSANINRNEFLYTLGNAISLSPSIDQVQIRIAENTIFSPVGHGVFCPFDNAIGSVAIQENSILFTGGDGINMTLTNLLDVSIDISKNILSNFTTGAVFIDAQGSVGIEALVNTTLSNNQISSQTSSSSPSVRLLTQNDTKHYSTVIANQIENAYANQGILIEDLNSTTLSLTDTVVRGNEINGVSGAVYVNGDPTGAGTIRATIEGNSITNASSGPEGVIAIGTFGTQVATGLIQKNSLGSPSGGISGNGIRLNLASTSGNMTLANNIISNCTSPYSITCSSGDQFLNIQSNTAQNNPATQFDLQVSGGSTIAIVENNTFTANTTGFSADFQTVVSSGSLCLRLQNNVSSLGYSLTSFDTLNFEYPAVNIGDLHFGSVPTTMAPGIILVPPGTCN